MKTLVYGSSIKGNGHFVSGTECQDSNSFLETDFSEDEIKVIALSDGHGGAPYLRSAQGSKLAVEIAKKELYAFVHKVKDLLDEIDSVQHIMNTHPPQFAIKVGEKKEPLKSSPEASLLTLRVQTLEKRLDLELDTVKESIVKTWCKAVDDAFEADPIEVVEAEVFKFNSIDEEPMTEVYVGYGDAIDDRISFINCNLGNNIIRILERNPRELYGATLLAVAQYKDHIFIFQLGDGDITIVDDEDHSERIKVKADNLIGDETYSLCQTNAVNYADVVYFRRKIKIVMLSSDGISKASDDENLLSNIAHVVYESINEAPEELRTEFKPMLRRFSNSSSDDCTICFIANGINDESYEIIKASEEQDEEHSLDSLRRPLFDAYNLNRDLYLLGETEDKKKPIVSEVKFTKIGITAIQKSFLKEQYIDLIESKKQIASMTWQRSLLLDILAYGKHYLEEKEGSLKTTQEEAYRNAINEILVANPIRLIRFKSSSLEMKSKGALKIHTSEERFAIVLAVEGSVMKIVDIAPKVYDLICTEFSSLVTFVGHLPITEEYKLNINKYDLMLKKEN